MSMREGIKHLCEVCDFQGGSQPPKEEWAKEPLPNYVRMLQIRDFTQSSTDYIEYVKTSKSLKYCNEDDILIGRYGASVGKILTGLSGAYNVAIIKAIPNETMISKGFLKSYFLSPSFQLKLSIVSQHRAAQAGFSKEDIADFEIPVPPLAEQERIVAELDLLSGIIDKQKAQLKELDTLAQSIFYDMFGNPVENEKGWETKKLSTVSTLINGRAYNQNELLNDGKYKILRVGNFFTNSNYYYSDLELEEEKYCDTGDLLFAWSASFGAFIWKGGKVIFHYHIWKVLYDKEMLDIQYYRYLLNTMTASFMKDVHGIGMVHLTKAGMEQYLLPIPPIALQQSFASKINTIERQKETINQSIAESQKLFDYTMEKYFG